MDELSHITGRLQRVAEEHGHRVGEPADVVFMMQFPRLVEEINKATKHAKPGGRRVLALRVILEDDAITRGFFKSRKVMDVVESPNTDDATRQLFYALERGDTSNLS